MTEVSAMTKCHVPPAGWRCTREAGHEGPCAAWPTPCAAAKRPAIVRAFSWVVCQLFRGHDERLFSPGSREQDLYECQRCGMYHGRPRYQR